MPEKPGQYYVSGGNKVWICEFLIIPGFIGGWCNDAANPVVQAWMPLGAKQILEALPSVDAVEVVRCKDCKWGREVCGNIECFVDSNVPPEYHGYEWFCPNGERRR